MREIDLRSDTVTRPTPAMLQHMMRTEVGDDVFGEDPATNKFQQEAAQFFGKEAALFFPSGTMANQVAINVHTSPGDEVICHEDSHVYLYEGGGIAKNSGSSVRPVAAPRAVLTPELIERVINPKVDWMARTKLVVLEDTSNRGGGSCYSLREIEEVARFCKSRSLILHLDGARVFNAIIAKGHDPVQYAANFDTISACFSKGLGAPVGSVLIGSVAFIAEARRVRKVMGGGMRQTGYLAAACSFALKNHVARLKSDHEKAKKLATLLKKQSWVKSLIEPETNIVIIETANPGMVAPVLKQLREAGILATEFGPGRIRFVVHLDISDADIERAEKIIDSLHPQH